MPKILNATDSPEESIIHWQHQTQIEKSAGWRDELYWLLLFIDRHAFSSTKWRLRSGTTKLMEYHQVSVLSWKCKILCYGWTRRFAVITMPLYLLTESSFSCLIVRHNKEQARVNHSLTFHWLLSINIIHFYHTVADFWPTGAEDELKVHMTIN